MAIIQRLPFVFYPIAVDFVQEHVPGQQKDESAIEQTKDEAIKDKE